MIHTRVREENDKANVANVNSRRTWVKNAGEFYVLSFFSKLEIILEVIEKLETHRPNTTCGPPRAGSDV